MHKTFTVKFTFFKMLFCFWQTPPSLPRCVWTKTQNKGCNDVILYFALFFFNESNQQMHVSLSKHFV